MAALNGAGKPPLALDAIGQIQFIPPKDKELGGKQENFEDVAFNARGYLFLMGPGCEKAFPR